MKYIISNIRKLICESLNEDQLTGLSFDYFRPVYDNFTQGQQKNERVIKLIEYAEKQQKILKLLGEVEKINSGKYEEFKDKLIEKETKIRDLINFREALMDAYPNPSSLAKMLDEEMGIELGTISQEKEIREIIYKVVEMWANPKDMVEELLEAAKIGNPGNEKLKQDFTQSSKFLKALSISAPEEKQSICLLEEIWDNLVQILNGVDDPCLMSAYRLALPYADEFSYLKLRDAKNLKLALKNILVKENQDIQGLLKFGQYLSCTKKIGENRRQQLRQWLRESAKKLAVSHPDPLTILLPGILHSYLLIAVLTESDQYRLQAEFIRDDRQEFQSEPVDLIKYIGEQYRDTKSGQEIAVKGIVCGSFNQVIEKINSLIYLVMEDIKFLKNIINEGQTFKFTIELFLGYQDFERDFNQWKTKGDIGEDVCIFSECNLMLRSLERASRTGLLNLAKQRWDGWYQKIDSGEADDEEILKGCQLPPELHLKCDELVELLSQQKKIGFIATESLLSSAGEVKELFQAILKSGVLVAFWLKSQDSENLKLEETIKEYLKLEYFQNNLSSLIEAVWQMRRQAHAKKEKANQHLGYHLGFLYENPYRRPHLPQQNPLVEFGL